MFIAENGKILKNIGHPDGNSNYTFGEYKVNYIPTD